MVLDTAVIKDASNGVRIKTWQVLILILGLIFLIATWQVFLELRRTLNLTSVRSVPFRGFLFQGGSGYVQGVRFQNVRMEDVANPIIIDQFYCDSPKSCENQVPSKFLSIINLNQKFCIGMKCDMYHLICF